LFSDRVGREKQLIGLPSYVFCTFGGYDDA